MSGGRPLIETGPEQFVRRNACDVCHKSSSTATAIRHDPPAGEKGDIGLCVPCHDERVLRAAGVQPELGDVLGEGNMEQLT